MTDEDHFRKLESMYRNAPCHDYYRPELKVLSGSSEVTIVAHERFYHNGGAVHGAVYFKALDDAAYFAVNSLVREVAVLTVTFQLQLMQPVRDGVLRATGTVTFASKHLYFAESVLADSLDHIVARGSGSFVPSRVPLDARIAYE